MKSGKDKILNSLEYSKDEVMTRTQEKIIEKETKKMILMLPEENRNEKIRRANLVFSTYNNFTFGAQIYNAV